MKITPKTPEEINSIKTPEDMWERIINSTCSMMWDHDNPTRIDFISPLVHRTFKTCEANNFTREQAAMVLAFNALERLEDLYEAYGKLSLQALKPYVIPKCDLSFLDINKIKGGGQ